MQLKNIQTKRDYINFLNEQASDITARVLRDEIDYTSDQDREEYIESVESFQEAISQLDERDIEWSLGDAGHVYDIIYDNYRNTIEYVEENVELREDQEPVETFKDYVTHCVAYDISKTVDEKIDQTLDEDTSVDVVET